jgi:hypothetical protein
MKMKRLKQFLPSPDQSPTKSRLLSDEKVIKETSDHLKDLTNEVLKEFRAFKIKPNLRSRPQSRH